ncbi:MAG: peptidylprolyl isomerase [Bacteroides sp.]|nr:peptidylprolyl isomerase [Prevotella sp.]MCM1408837.1 peptidylprolyl isomerase [Treponema brennaborense]MCM1470617.1 peptidylprolyl isomerase [Bacteroides sp.]
MKIADNKVVSLEYTLKDSGGEILDSTEISGPIDYIHGQNSLIPALEKELDGKQDGESFSVTLTPKDAYGERSQELIAEVPKSHFPADAEIEAGMQFEAENDAGSQLVTIAEVKDATVIVDANHPLAGKTLTFDIKISGIRDATENELQFGLSRGCGGSCGGCSDSSEAAGGCSRGCCGCGGC